jgi:hypothetical protein
MSPKPLVFLVFCLQPDGAHLVEGGVFGVPAPDLKAAADAAEAADELGAGEVRRVVRVELEMGEGAQRDLRIAEFIRTLGGLN